MKPCAKVRGLLTYLPTHLPHRIAMNSKRTRITSGKMGQIVANTAEVELHRQLSSRVGSRDKLNRH